MLRTSSQPNFTGVWELNPEASTLRCPVPSSLLVKIDHQAPILVQVVVLTDALGREQRQVFSYEIGAESFSSVGGAVRTRAEWKGKELVIETWTKRPDHESYFQDHWSLSEDGLKLTMTRRNDDLAGQISVLERLVGAEEDA